MILQCYARNGGRYADEADDLGSAISDVRHAMECFDSFQFGLYDTATNAVHLPDRDGFPLDYLLDAIRESCGLQNGHQFHAVNKFPETLPAND